MPKSPLTLILASTAGHPSRGWKKVAEEALCLPSLECQSILCSQVFQVNVKCELC